MSNKSQQATTKQRALIEHLLQLSEVANTENALFHQLAAESYGLGITDMKALGILLQEGGMNAGQIAKRLSLTTGAVTNIVDKLESRELVKRASDPSDRRKVIVVPNHKKIASHKNVYASMGEAFAALLKGYTEKELALLVDFHMAVIALTKSEIAKLQKVQN